MFTSPEFWNGVALSGAVVSICWYCSCLLNLKAKVNAQEESIRWIKADIKTLSNGIDIARAEIWGTKNDF